MALRSPTDALRTLRHWVDQRHSSANQPGLARAARQPLAPPHWDDVIKPLLNGYDRNPSAARPVLVELMHRHLHYAQASGDSHSLVKSHHQLARFLLKPGQPASNTPTLKGRARDAAWALELGQLSAVWAPGNPHSWSVVGNALDEQNDWSRARAVFWYARRRSPYNVFSHTQLSHALAMRGEVDEGEAVYRATRQRFPDNPVVWSALGHTLRVAHRHEAALVAYQHAQQRFPRDPIIATGLTTVLIELGDAPAANEALNWAQQVCGAHLDKDQRVLASLRRHYDALMAGRPMPLMQLAR